MSFKIFVAYGIIKIYMDMKSNFQGGSWTQAEITTLHEQRRYKKQ